MSLYIGLMSGTSADGLDAALVRINAGGVQLIDAVSLPYATEFQTQLRLLALQEKVSVLEVLHTERQLASYCTEAITKLLQRNQLSAKDIIAIGSHGHTLRHKPQPNGITWQIDDPSWIAEHTGITCVADFRRRDIAAGGHGAPLVPAFHAAVLPISSMALNIGGIANLTVIDAAGNAQLGFDTGPGNALIDEWCQNQLHRKFDAGGELARSGQVVHTLLDTWLRHPYFQQPPPKSTGRELFQLSYLGTLNEYNAVDVLATLTELTACSIALAVEKFGHANGELLICGGGVHNTYLLDRLTKLLPQHSIQSTARYGVDPDWLEAMAFAWLAQHTLKQQPSNAEAVTGAHHKCILGGVYFA